MTPDEIRFFDEQLTLHEAKYLAGTNPRQQSGFGRDQRDWERYRRIVTAPIDADGTFLDVGCANGLLMQSVAAWAAEDGHIIEPYGVEISPKLAELARTRLPLWKDRIFTGNALMWIPPFKFDFVRTEMVYGAEPPSPQLRGATPRGRCSAQRPSYRVLLRELAAGGAPRGSARRRATRLGLCVTRVHDVMSPDHGFVITRVVSVAISRS
jgi:SAM-dependent methyltransferase